ncbi:MAG TPA: FAD-dependent oxidoreductase [Clostridia bacterium]|nr:FAD-dependent oxidoreductase [Clostridia bacterium]
MRKRSITTAMLCMTLVGTMVGCGSASQSAAAPSGAPESPAFAYQAGSYTGTAKGNNGDIALEVTFDGNAITGITVKSQQETPGISDPAFAKIPVTIVENQALGIDTIAGCTVTSNAILAAVADAVKQAGGNVDALKAKAVTAKAGNLIEKTADVVIIGGGGAGMSAATAAAQAGASVIIIEKTAALGGNTLASGLAWNAADPEMQSKMDAIPGQVETLKAVLDYNEAEFGDFTPILKTLKEQIKTYLAGDTSKMFDTVEWHTIQTYTGGKRTDAKGNTVEGSYDMITKLCSESLDTYQWFAETTGITKADKLSSPVGSLWLRGHNFAKKTDVFDYSTKFVEKNAGEVMLETKAEELIITDGRVTGVKAIKTDGTPVTLTANKGVIVATGGFGANSDMVREYNIYWPTIPDAIKTTCVASATGDGIALGLQAGANLVDMGLTQMMPTANAFSGALADALLVAPQNYLFVNKQGNRFVDETAARDTLTFAALKQTDGMFYAIDDQEMAKTVQNRATQEQIDAMVEKGLIYKADTLEALAEKIGCDPAAFVETIKTYNTYVDNNADPDFGKKMFQMKVETAPFYACPAKPAVHHTMGGLQINTEAQVLNASGTPIPGLYAAGEITGGIHAGNRLGGNAIADIFVFGRTAGTNAAK